MLWVLQLKTTAASLIISPPANICQCPPECFSRPCSSCVSRSHNVLFYHLDVLPSWTIELPLSIASLVPLHLIWFWALDPHSDFLFARNWSLLLLQISPNNMNFFLVPICSLWTHLENRIGPSVSLMIMLASTCGKQSRFVFPMQESRLSFSVLGYYLSYKSLSLTEAAPAWGASINSYYIYIHT